MAEDPFTRLTDGNALLVATVDERGVPFATRGWGVVRSPDDPDLVRLVLDADDVAASAGAFVPGGPIAITGADPVTVRSSQAKGHIVGLEELGPDDVATSSRHKRMTFAAICEADHVDRELLERIAPRRLAVCTVRVEEHYDQTPGPGAGAPVGPGT